MEEGTSSVTPNQPPLRSNNNFRIGKTVFVWPNPHHLGWRATLTLANDRLECAFEIAHILIVRA
jgi:hypothetical protein